MAEEEQNRINMNIVDGGEFFAHEISINFSPTQFVFDFKSITPRIDPRGKGRPSITLRHNVVLIEPYHAKRMLELLQEVVKKYEDDFGKIEKPKQVQKMEKKRQKTKTKPKGKSAAPAYFG